MLSILRGKQIEANSPRNWGVEYTEPTSPLHGEAGDWRFPLLLALSCVGTMIRTPHVSHMDGTMPIQGGASNFCFPCEENFL
jgi:hypothetical protein